MVSTKSWRAASAVAALTMAFAPAAMAAGSTTAHTSVYSTRNADDLLAAARAARPLDKYVDPKALPRDKLLQNNTLPPGAAASKPGATGGSSDGAHKDQGNDTGSGAYGTFSPLAIAPYSASGAYATVKGPATTAAMVAVTSYPWRATGKLSFNINGSPFVCSGSMILPGLLVTAAHCVFEFGTNSSAGWHTNFVFVPARSGNKLPYGSWTALTERIPTTYYNGTDTCTTRGVVCNNDIAIITMAPNANGKLPGSVVGWYGYGWNGYSYVSSFGGASLSSLTQLGYPVAFDQGIRMERNDGVGAYWTSGNLQNTLLGSALTGGASGGPWLVNFGARPVLSSSASLGNAANSNVVEGVSSWLYTTVGTNTWGASWFGQNVEYSSATNIDSQGIDRGAGNIGLLVRDACNANFDHC